MNRREFIAGLAGSAIWPIDSRGQNAATKTVGLLGAASDQLYRPLIGGLFHGLKEAGYVEGADFNVTGAWAEGRLERLTPLAADLVEKRIAVIVTFGGSQAALAAKARAESIPVVFVIQDDPVKLGLVTSFQRPSGNATGLATLTAHLDAKLFALFREFLPNARAFGVVINPRNPEVEARVKEIRAAAASLGVEVIVASAGTPLEFGAALSTFGGRIQALFVASDPLFRSFQNEVLPLVARDRIPASYSQSEFAAAGGLMSYGPDLPNIYRQVGRYVARILNGERPGDLPVLEPSKFHLVVNIRSARSLGIEVPPSLLARADEVIE